MTKEQGPTSVVGDALTDILTSILSDVTRSVARRIFLRDLLEGTSISVDEFEKEVAVRREQGTYPYKDKNWRELIDDALRAISIGVTLDDERLLRELQSTSPNSFPQEK